MTMIDSNDKGVFLTTKILAIDEFKATLPKATCAT